MKKVVKVAKEQMIKVGDEVVIETKDVIMVRRVTNQGAHVHV